MANKMALEFSLRAKMDGIATTLSFATATGPIGLFASGTLGELSSLVNATTAVPSAVDNVSDSNGTALTATILLGVVTITWPAAPAAGYLNVIGTFLF